MYCTLIKGVVSPGLKNDMKPHSFTALLDPPVDDGGKMLRCDSRVQCGERPLECLPCSMADRLKRWRSRTMRRWLVLEPPVSAL